MFFFLGLFITLIFFFRIIDIMCWSNVFTFLHLLFYSCYISQLAKLINQRFINFFIPFFDLSCFFNLVQGIYENLRLVISIETFTGKITHSCILYCYYWIALKIILLSCFAPKTNAYCMLRLITYL